MARLLLLETATGICSVGIAENRMLIEESTASEAYRHAAQLTVLIEGLITRQDWSLAEIDAVVLSSGPGSYTSLRVGAATAKGICYALNKPLIAVETLAALAGAARREAGSPNDLYLPMIDARRMEVYGAVYDRKGTQLSPVEAHVVEPTSFDNWRTADRLVWLCGNGAEKCRPVLGDSGFAYLSHVECAARHLLPPALEKWEEKRFENLINYEPKYVKPPNVTKPKARL